MVRQDSGPLFASRQADYFRSKRRNGILIDSQMNNMSLKDDEDCDSQNQNGAGGRAYGRGSGGEIGGPAGGSEQ